MVDRYVHTLFPEVLKFSLIYDANKLRFKSVWYEVENSKAVFLDLVLDT